MAGDVRFEQADGIGVLTIANPRRLNAISGEMWAALAAHLDKIAVSSEVRALLIRGEGHAFSSGGDITEYDALARCRSLALSYHRAYGGVLRSLRALPIGTVAAVDGVCYGAGLAIAAACDFRLCSTRARFGITAVSRGLVYPLEELRQLQALVGVGMVRRLVLLGREVPARDMAANGFADAMVAPEALQQESRDVAAALAGRAGGPFARTKLLIEQSIMDGARDVPAMVELATSVYGSAEFAAGTSDFLQRQEKHKRKDD